MKCADVSSNFPFTFSDEATFQICENQETRCSFLSRRGIHRLEMWMAECSCGLSAASFDSARSNNYCWDLPCFLSPCSGPLSPLTKLLSSWRDYYEWRSIPLNSPEIPLQRDGEETDLCSYVPCADSDCVCKSSSENFECNGSTDRSSAVTLQLHKGFYHDCYRDIARCPLCELHRHGSLPQLIIAPNAGIAAYPSWSLTIELIKDLNVPAVFSDYCEEACHLLTSCIVSRPKCSQVFS